MSSKILKGSFGRPIDANQLAASERAGLFVEPGEMVFVLTEERLTLPANMFAELSPKRKLSHAGILAIGGFCIDPRYPGHLLIGLFNLSSTRFPLLPGKKVIAATFYELTGDELSDFPLPESAVDDFPDELIVVMQKYSPLAVQSVQESVDKLRGELDAIREDIRSHSDWYRRFEQSLEHHDRQIGQLLQGLSDEKSARTTGEDKLGTTLAKIDRTLTWLKGAAWVAAGLVTLVGIPVFVAWLLKTLGIIK
ncbi:MAG TPA: hypothetical protein VMB25_11520 [Bryobacteraceae bacterium]|nr:hypothetical protein [Bryobacteraceae bacterium]